ncbi:hypothetical protein [Actinoallomurus acaciae]|uniref:Uncharacterized protein n=1 Tax=Actinoallomurus acaciae TaxID=502577 RepID=A0ABV5YYG0_9ACTN
MAFVAATALGERLTGFQLSRGRGGLGALAFAGGVSRRQADAIGAALLTGVSIAGYIDGVGVRHPGTALGYSGWLFLCMGRRSSPGCTWRAARPYGAASPPSGGSACPAV